MKSPQPLLSLNEAQKLANAITEIGGTTLLEEWNMISVQFVNGANHCKRVSKQFKESVRNGIEKQLEIVASDPFTADALSEEDDYFQAHYQTIRYLIEKMYQGLYPNATPNFTL